MTNQIALNVRNTLTGILPPLSMPFDEQGNLVSGALKGQIDLMVEAGVRGVVAGGSTGEGHTLSASEFTDAMIEALGVSRADPSRMHHDALVSRARLEDARDRVAAALGARSREVVFTSGATESIIAKSSDGSVRS